MEAIFSETNRLITLIQSHNFEIDQISVQWSLGQYADITVNVLKHKKTSIEIDALLRMLARHRRLNNWYTFILRLNGNELDFETAFNYEVA